MPGAMDIDEKLKEREWALETLQEITAVKAEKWMNEMQRKVDAGLPAAWAKEPNKLVLYYFQTVRFQRLDNSR